MEIPSGGLCMNNDKSKLKLALKFTGFLFLEIWLLKKVDVCDTSVTGQNLKCSLKMLKI